MADIAALVSARGYVKGQITRLHKFLETPEFEKASASLLQTKKELLVSTFKDYVSYNMKIALVKPDDAEDAGKQEEKYCETLARINDEIDAKKKASGAEGVHAPMAHTKLPNIEIPTFTEFLQKKAMALESVDGNGARPVRASVNVTVEERPQQRQCPFCKYNKEFHKLFACPKFKLAPVKERMQFVNENKLCRVCLGAHQGRCKYHFRCQTCKKTSHSTLLHEDSPAVNLCMKEESQVVMMAQDDKNDLSLLPTVKVKLIRSDGTEMIIKAGLDSFSQVSLVTSQVVQALGLKPKHSSTEIVGVGNVTSTSKYSIPLEVFSIHSNYKVNVNCKVVDEITCKLPQQKFPRFKLPANIELADDTYNQPSNIDMILAGNIFLQSILRIVPQHELLAGDGADLPPALRIISTQFGDVLGGDLTLSTPSQQHKVALLCTTCDSSISKTVKKFWQTEEVPQIFNENATESELCEDIFKKSVQLKDQRFQVDLPLKVPLDQVNDHLGDSFHLALNRFVNLEKKLHKDEQLFQQYKKFIDEIIELGHGRYIDINQYDFKKDPLCFIAHQAVINEKSKTTKLRSVLDAAMKTSNKISLNDLLLNGDVVQRDLFGILLLFRLGEHMFTTDIKKMFRCINLNPMHASLQNILWRENPNTEIKCIQLTTVQFGLKSSSFLATRCLDELASIYKEELPLASFILKNCTFVDDILYAESDVDKMVEAKKQLVELLKRGGFQTHKWASNSSQVLQDIPQNEQHFDNIDFEKQNYSLRALGINYNVKEDCFTVSCPEKFGDRAITKREILSYVTKFYDPLGFISPIIVTAKSFIQTLWAANINWDSPLTGVLKEKWVKFARNLDNMAPITLKRSVSIAHAHTIELVGFADASSTTAYGCCIYLRLIHEGKASLYLLCSKSRVNPLKKPLTVPRLELNAALLLAKLMVKVHEAISTKTNVHFVRLFCDSKIVLAWIRTQVTQLNAYVANRVQVVTQLTAEWTWHYIPTSDNPADLITRGVSPQELGDSALWWSGPSFLQNDKYEYVSKVDLPTSLPETKKAQAEESIHSHVALPAVIEANDLFERYSDIHKMTRIFAYLWRFYYNCKTKDDNKRVKTTYLTTKEINNSLLSIIKHEQHKYFSKEINSLQNNTQIKNSSLKPLCPHLDKFNMLRVTGRLQNAAIPYSQKHPIILPKDSRITDMVIQSEHKRLMHAGPKLLLSVLNERYWLINGPRHVKKIINKCITCFKLKKETQSQLMGNLPEERVVQSAGCFERVGIDYAGPIEIKQSKIRRSVISKGYICLFVCFTTKAVHIELASDLTTAAFLACFRRFTSRRGFPHDVFCDNASNFKGAKNQLADLYKLVNSQSHQSQVINYALKDQIRFHFIPSYSPVFGGLWEAAVKSTKYHLKRAVGNTILTFEEMYTVLTQIEAILNSRPLVPLSSDSDEFAYLTPGHFITGKAIVSYPDRDLTDIPISRLKLWNVINKIVQSFWQTWHKYYLNTLQSRPKWRDEVQNVKVGDLVLLRDDGVPPLMWPMGRITKLFPGTDDKVRAFEVMTPNRKKHVRSITKICLFPINKNE